MEPYRGFIGTLQHSGFWLVQVAKFLEEYGTIVSVIVQARTVSQSQGSGPVVPG